MVVTRRIPKQCHADPLHRVTTLALTLGGFCPFGNETWNTLHGQCPVAHGRGNHVHVHHFDPWPEDKWSDPDDHINVQLQNSRTEVWSSDRRHD